MKIIHEEAFKRLQSLSDTGISRRGAASVLCREGLFGSLEDARNFVRWHTGSQGARSKTAIQWKNDIPMPESTGFGVRDISSANGILMLCDLHIPFHNKEVIKMAFGSKDQYDTIILQEVFDFYGLSKFDKMTTISPAREQEQFFQFMDWVREQVPDHRIIFQLGNHDERFLLTFMRKAPEIAEMAGMEFSTIFSFDDYKIEMLPMRNLLKYRDLFIGHGHEINAKGVPVSPARTFYLKARGNFIGGHFHRTSEFITRDIKDDIQGCWSVGCACDLHPLYAPVNDWNNGYAIIRPHGENHFRVKNIKIFD